MHVYNILMITVFSFLTWIPYIITVHVLVKNDANVKCFGGVLYNHTSQAHDIGFSRAMSERLDVLALLDAWAFPVIMTSIALLFFVLRGCIPHGASGAEKQRAINTMIKIIAVYAIIMLAVVWLGLFKIFLFVSLFGDAWHCRESNLWIACFAWLVINLHILISSIIYIILDKTHMIKLTMNRDTSMNFFPFNYSEV